MVETLFGLIILVAGGTFVMLRRRRIGRAVWPAAAGLTLLALSLLAGNAWTLYQWGVAEAGAAADKVTVLRWGSLIGTVIEFAFVAGMVTLAVSIFIDRRPRTAEIGR